MKKLMIPIVLAAFALSMIAAPAFAVQNQAAQEKEPKKQASRIYIPKEVKDVLVAGLPARQPRQDIPFSVIKTTYLPAQSGSFAVFFLKIKNADLGFVPDSAPQVADAAAVIAQPKLKATFDVFLQFHKTENGVPTSILKEVYVPAVMEEDPAGFNPEKEEWYTVGYPVPPGTFVLALAVTTHDLKKIGTQYVEFVLPDPKAAAKEMDTTPVLFLKEYADAPAAETITAIHKGFFRWATLKITPNIDNVFNVGDVLDLFFYINGAQPNDQNKFDIDCQYVVNQGDKLAINFASAKYDTPFISQPLPLKQTLNIKKETEKGTEERQEVRDLPPGTYTFQVNIKDNVSGKTCTKSLDFTVKEPAAK